MSDYFSFKSPLMRSRKGQDVNLLFVVVMVLILAIVIVVGYKVAKQVNTNFQGMNSIPTEAKNMTQNVVDHYVNWMDALFLVLFLFMSIILIASAFFIDTHPVFFIISLMIVVISAFVGGHIANAYSEFENSLSAEATEFSMIPYIFQHFVGIITIVGMLTLIALFAKLRSQ